MGMATILRRMEVAGNAVLHEDIRRETLFRRTRRLHGRNKGSSQRQLGAKGLDDHDDFPRTVPDTELEMQSSRKAPSDPRKYNIIDGILSRTNVPENSKSDPEA